MNRNAFTLIELLIVVAIIAILAAIAVPNFLEAQTRSKVSRTKADMRTIATGLEVYAVDNNAYPPCHTYGIAMTAPDLQLAPGIPILERLTTPVAYLTTVSMKDPFKIFRRTNGSTADAQVSSVPIAVTGNDPIARYNTYIYQAFNSDNRAQITTDSFAPVKTKATAWVLHSAGPDGTYQLLGGVLDMEYTAGPTGNTSTTHGPIDLIYDPTNGTISFGSIYRAGGKAGPNATSGFSSQTAYAGGKGLMEAIDTQK